MKNNFIMHSFIKLPTPSNINYLWNMGFILGIILTMQIITGILLSFHFCPNSLLSFQSMNHITREVNFGWIIQLSHMNGASFFFILAYSHIARGLYFFSFFKKKVWFSGILLILTLMLTAFLGYVLPWGQMSFWGATVITNLLSSVPYIGQLLVEWVWGGFSVDSQTLTRFFSIHFILPMLMVIMSVTHLIILHEYGSSNPLGTNSDLEKTPFSPYFLVKDILSFMLVMMIMFTIILISPFLLSDPENFNQANPMITPVHIQPEWYFLFAYAILRSIPNKLGGVIALMSSILIISLLPLKKKNLSPKFHFTNKIIMWFILSSFLILTWIGACPVEDPFILIGQIFSVTYFSLWMMFISY